MIAVEVLLQRQADVRRVDVVLCIVDASNLERHLYLLSQVLELGLPTVVAVNMLDVAASRGIKLELRHLQNRLGVPVVPIQANRGKGLAEIKAALMEVLHRDAAGRNPRFFPRSSKRRPEACNCSWQPKDATAALCAAANGCRRAGGP